MKHQNILNKLQIVYVCKKLPINPDMFANVDHEAVQQKLPETIAIKLGPVIPRLTYRMDMENC